MSARRLSPEARARYVRIPLGQLPGQSGARPGYRALAYRAVVQPRDAPGACRGSRPFRRAALGIVKIILERKLPVSLSLSIGAAGKALLSHKPKRGVSPDQESKILDFVLDRARFVFREKEQFAYDEVSAVFRAGADDLVDTEKRLLALRAIRKSRNFEPLAVSFKRIRKILEKAGVAPGQDGQVNPALF